MKIKSLLKFRTTDHCEVQGCGKKDDLTIDHIIPVAFFNLFTPQWIISAANIKLNLRVLCKEHNSEKGHKVELTDENVATMKRVIDAAQKEWKQNNTAESLFKNKN